MEDWIGAVRGQARALEARKHGRDWLAYFPHAGTWLNGERWTDARDDLPEESSPPGMDEDLLL